MDPSDSDFLKLLFKENNELRVKLSAAQRQIFNKASQCDALEEDLCNLANRGDKPKNERDRDKQKAIVAIDAPTKGFSKELEQALLAIESLNNEITHLKAELVKVGIESRDNAMRAEKSEEENKELYDQVRELEEYKEKILENEGELTEEDEAEKVSEIIDENSFGEKVKGFESEKAILKQQTLDVIQESNKIQNGLQNQLQGAQALIESIKNEYEEFIKITKMEYEAYKNHHTHEYETLKSTFESAKLKFLEDKKMISHEYQSILYSMQSHFEEYRKTSEFLFSAELVKLGDELTTQAQKYEAEIMYIVQAKDKFYSDLMVSKDAKIMSLIEGSDLQSLMQKNELDLENLRKEHTNEIERIKIDQETESKNIIALLQRQNVTLESKCDKIQSHLKLLEGRMKDLLITIDQKNKTISEKDELILKTEIENKAKFSEINAKLNIISQEKEHLRHKVIRLNLDARGEGENSIQNMIKRITRETADLKAEVDSTGAKYDGLLSENQILIQKLKEREKMVEFLEKEMHRRSDEFQSMTKTFEDFLTARARQARKEQIKRLTKIAATKEVSVEASEKKNINLSPNNGGPKVVKAYIPDRAEHSTHVNPDASKALLGQVELERGYAYLKRFKNLSKAFASGDFRIISHGENAMAEKNLPGPWQQTSLYSKLNEDSAVTQLYKEPRKEVLPLSESQSKPIIYTGMGELNNDTENGEQGVKLYGGKSSKQGIQSKKPEIINPIKKHNKGFIHIGGSGIKVDRN